MQGLKFSFWNWVRFPGRWLMQPKFSKAWVFILTLHQSSLVFFAVSMFLKFCSPFVINMGAVHLLTYISLVTFLTLRTGVLLEQSNLPLFILPLIPVKKKDLSLSPLEVASSCYTLLWILIIWNAFTFLSKRGKV